jgi:hypothetical protein
LCFEYQNLQTDEDRAEFFARHGTRWTEFARLVYFDLIRWTIVDPMHNLLLGELQEFSSSDRQLLIFETQV